MRKRRADGDAYQTTRSKSSGTWIRYGMHHVLRGARGTNEQQVKMGGHSDRHHKFVDSSIHTILIQITLTKTRSAPMKIIEHCIHQTASRSLGILVHKSLPLPRCRIRSTNLLSPPLPQQYLPKQFLFTLDLAHRLRPLPVPLPYNSLRTLL